MPVELGSVLECSHACGESRTQAAKITEPCDGSLNFPTLAVSSQFSSILRFRLFTVLAMRNNQIDFNRLQSLSERITVIGSMCDQALRAFFGAPSSLARNADPIQCFFGQGHFRGRCRGKRASHMKRVYLAIGATPIT